MNKNTENWNSPQNEVSQSKKSELDEFLRGWNLDKWVKEKIEKIHKHILLLNKSIKGKPLLPWKNRYGCFNYYIGKKQKSFLSICPRNQKKEFAILFLKKSEKQEVTDEIWKLNDKKGGHYRDFKWKITLKSEEDYKNFKNSLGDYMNKIKEKKQNK